MLLLHSRFCPVKRLHRQDSSIRCMTHHASGIPGESVQAASARFESEASGHRPLGTAGHKRRDASDPRCHRKPQVEKVVHLDTSWLA